MERNELLTYILGGGMASALVGFFTMRSTVRKANAEAERAKADAETVRIDNSAQATKVLITNIVEPLRDELRVTRDELRETKREFSATKREMARFRKAIETASQCVYKAKCPVLEKLDKEAKINDNDNGQ